MTCHIKVGRTAWVVYRNGRGMVVLGEHTQLFLGWLAGVLR